MKKNRIIPVIILKNNEIVQSYNFSNYKITGDALKAVERLSQWDADEMIYLNITKPNEEILRRQDLNTTKIRSSTELISEVAKRSTMPLTFGGGLRSLQDIESVIYSGADKISVNTLLFDNPKIVREAVGNLGSQAIVASVDYALKDGRRVVWHPSSRSFLDIELSDWIKSLEEIGVGEILLNCIDRDGTKLGYDTKTLKEICELTSLPVIALGGVGSWDHLKEGLMAGADAVAAANIFHFYDQSVYLAKRNLYDAKIPVRIPSLAKVM